MKRIIPWAAVAFLFFVGQTHAGVIPAITLNAGNQLTDGIPPSPVEFGWEFTPSENIQVTALGTWTGSSDNLPAGTEVGLFANNGGELLASVSITSANSFLDNQFQYVDLTTPATLTANEAYTVIAYFPGNTVTPEYYNSSSSSFTASSVLGDIHFTNSYLNNGQGLTYLGTLPGGPADYVQFGPNFQFEAAAAAPEPGTLTIVGISIAGMAGYGWRRKRSA
jgi:hypothetical protein